MPETPVGRFAPTPSGRLHLGNLLCAMLAWLSVKSRGGRFLLRIEDVDVPRCPRSLSEACIHDLEWLGFTWDEPPLYQSERTEIYAEYLRRLDAFTYPCFCTRAQLRAESAPNLGDTQLVYSGACKRLPPEERARLAALRSPAIRMTVPDETITFTDGLYGKYSENPATDCGDFILRRSDGLYGYQLAVVVDDALTGVNEVVRGRDILSATPRQIVLQQALGFPQPDYFHIPLLMDHAGRRLAKRDRDLDLTALSKRFTPEEILGLLACACGLQEEPCPATLEKLAADFDWSRIKREDMRLPVDLTET